MTEFQELTKDAPKFASMERGELVAYAYAMYAAGAKMDAENAKLRELCADLYFMRDKFNSSRATMIEVRMHELGIEA